MFGQSNDQLKHWLTHISKRVDPVSQGWAIVLGGNIGRMALSFIASILVVRVLGPAEFGAYAVLGAAIAIVGIVADLGLTTTEVKRVAAVWPEQTEEAHRRGHVGTWFRAGAALFFFILTVFLARPITDNLLGLSDLPNASSLFVLAMAGMVAVALSGTVAALLQATNNFGRLSTMSLVNAGLTTILAILLVFAGQLNLVTALLVLGIGTSLATLLVGYRMLPGRWSLWRVPDLDDLHQEGSALFHFSRWLWIGSLFAVITLQVDVILVNQLTTAAAAGFYALALNLARKADVVNQSLHTALLPAASSLSNRQAIRSYLHRSMLRSGLIALGLLVLIPLAGLFIGFFYGPEYVLATGLFQLLLIMVIIDAFATPITLLVYPLERPKLFAASAAVQATLLVVLTIVLIPFIGTPGAAIAKIAARVAGLLLIIWRLRVWRYLSKP